MRGKKPDHGRGTALAESLEANGLKIKGRLWVEKNGEVYLSWGRVVLLERIKELGSISAAARSMGTAYSHAWLMVSSMDRLAGENIVDRTHGGRHGGQARLTPLGEAAIQEFWDLAANFREWLENQSI